MTAHVYSTNVQKYATLEVPVGTISAGDQRSLYREDSEVLVIDEVTGTPGFEVVLTFEAIRTLKKYTNTVRINLVGYYSGNLGHDVKMYIWNYNTETWDAMTSDAKDIPDALAEDAYSFQVFADDYVSGERTFKYAGFDNEVKILISHDSPGNAAHKLYLNRAYLEFVQVGTDRHKQVIAHA